ncbi:hypothetical protein GE061_014214 [Apolygus lucorum]|uniref:Uncharacterized protein n=1 Tax=Apolygus lucorum TaxID=248454 RepID=A0A6A4KB21_APOLU|nr:hypothetical protein GE061_014214 [Apolygus lucorum]
MLINFAYEGLLTVECDCLQLDGHRVTNLVNVDKTKRAKGFLADRFIKPPANITFTFKCNVDITKVILLPRVGSQKSSGFEIFKVFKNQTIVSIAQSVIHDQCERVEFSRQVAGENTVRFCSDRAGERVRQLRVRIFKTSGSTVPALGGLEIWGRPSSNVPEHIKNEIIDLWKSIILRGPNDQKDRSVSEDTVASLPPTDTRRVLRQEVVVPEEFVDPISCEIMTIPMTLPSGNIVDLSTLEKFYVAETKLGRGRSDPFTGVLFSEQSKPVAAVSLKARLDKFLLENCDDPRIKVLPRTLGKKLVAPWSSYSSTNTSANQQIFRGESSNRTAQSVDQLLTDCLEGLPSYIDETPPSSKKLKVGCAKCLDPSSSNSDTFFKLPCQHTVCRKCLCVMRQNSSALCRECDQPFGFESIERHHV